MNNEQKCISGIYTISAEEYHADHGLTPSLSASTAHILCSQSPLHAWTASRRLNPNFVEEESTAMDVGKVAHALLLEGIEITEVLDYPDWRTNAAKAARDVARQAGKVPLLKQKWSHVQALVFAAKRQLADHADASHALLGGKPEQSLFWFDEEYGINGRARLDYLSDDRKQITDLKTSGITANPDAVSRSLFQNGLDIQAEWYRRGVKILTGVEAEFRFVFVETVPPYALSVIALGPEAQVMAQKKIAWAAEAWKKCLDSGKWPGWPNKTCFAELPPWEEARWLEKELAI